MTKVVPFMPPAQRRRERAERASLWVLRLDAGLSLADLRDLHAWVDEDARHLQVLLAAAALWDRASVLAELSELFPLERYLAPRRPPWLRLLPAALAAVLLGGDTPRKRRPRRLQ